MTRALAFLRCAEKRELFHELRRVAHYILGGGRGGGPGDQGTSSQITSWVESHFKSATIGGEAVYLLLEPK